MSATNNHLIFKIFIIGAFVATLIYCFHPGAGQFSVVVNGQPVAEPLIRFAAIPTMLIAMLLTGILMLFAFFGVGLLLFLVMLGFSLLGILIVAPYFWPLLLIVFLAVLFSSFGNKNK